MAKKPTSNYTQEEIDLAKTIQKYKDYEFTVELNFDKNHWSIWAVKPGIRVSVIYSIGDKPFADLICSTLINLSRAYK